MKKKFLIIACLVVCCVLAAVIIAGISRQSSEPVKSSSGSEMTEITESVAEPKKVSATVDPQEKTAAGVNKKEAQEVYNESVSSSDSQKNATEQEFEQTNSAEQKNGSETYELPITYDENADTGLKSDVDKTDNSDSTEDTAQIEGHNTGSGEYELPIVP